MIELNPNLIPSWAKEWNPASLVGKQFEQRGVYIRILESPRWSVKHNGWVALAQVDDLLAFIKIKIKLEVPQDHEVNEGSCQKDDKVC